MSGVASEVHPPAQGNEETGSTVSMYVDSIKSLLQTCFTLAPNAETEKSHNQERLRRILDSRSQKTYTTQRIKEALGLKSIARETLYIKAFGLDCNNVKTVVIVSVCLKNVSSDNAFILTAHVVPMIFSPSSHQTVHFSKQRYPHLEDIVLMESGSADNLKVDFIVGADRF